VFKEGLIQPFSQERALKKNEVKVSPPAGRGDLEGAKNAFAVIFDMDGTLIDNTPYHFKSWQALYKKYGKGELSKQTYYTEISGVPIMETLKRVFGNDHNEPDLKELLKEKDAFYRKIYAPFLVAVNGLENFLSSLKSDGVKMAMATSATLEDIDFILNKVPIRDNFDVIVNSSMVSKPKPHPQIFLKAAEELGMDPDRCIVFEDSLSGIKAADSAGMKVVAITTGHTADELHPVDLIINDYAGLTPHKLSELFKEDKDE
jgi:beta-phosphoglucomutase family hydrolase